MVAIMPLACRSRERSEERGFTQARAGIQPLPIFLHESGKQLLERNVIADFVKAQGAPTDVEDDFQSRPRTTAAAQFIDHLVGNRGKRGRAVKPRKPRRHRVASARCAS